MLFRSSSFCGVVGLKPSTGRIPQSRALQPDIFSQLAPYPHYGPHARNVKDAAFMLEIMAGPHSRDPFTLPDDGTEFVKATQREIVGKSIAYSPDLGLFPVSKEVRSVVEDSIEIFEAMGADINYITPNFNYSREELINVYELWSEVLLATRASNVKQRLGVDILGEDRDKLSSTLIEYIEAADNVDIMDYKQTGILRTNVFDTVQNIFNSYDLLVTPTVAVPPFDISLSLGPDEVDGEDVHPHVGWSLTWVFNMTDHPAASIPAGLNSDGLPIGLQIVGPRFADDEVIAASAAFERGRPWEHIYPPDLVE